MTKKDPLVGYRYHFYVYQDAILCLFSRNQRHSLNLLNGNRLPFAPSVKGHRHPIPSMPPRPES